MQKKPIRTPRRGESLSRAQIVQASIELLDANGEDGLTFRALAERLATGAGAIYGHVTDKKDLLTAACDAIVVKALEDCARARSPRGAIRAIALGLFDALDAHPWVGSALTRAEIDSPMVHVLERVGQQIRAVGVARDREWAAVAALMNYIIGVAAQNAANGQNALRRGLDREQFLGSIAAAWLRLDAQQYPFTRSVAELLPLHDDRADFLSGIDLILEGMTATKASPRSTRRT